MITAAARRLSLALLGGALVLSSVPAASATHQPAAQHEPSTAATATTVGGSRLAEPGPQVAPRDGVSVDPLPGVQARSWLLADVDTGEVLAAKDAHDQHLPASTLKLLTAITLIPRLPADQVYTATDADAGIEGSKVGLVPEGTYTVDDLFRALFLSSGNDAANALANANGGMARTVEQMNAVAAELGAADTVARNTSGLDADGQVSSAYDLALIARAGLEMPEFREYATMRRTEFPGRPTKRERNRPTFDVYNRNPLITKQYRGALGLKTGYTDAARRTFVGAAERGGRTLVVTLMGYEGDTYEYASSLLTWGFKFGEDVDPVGQLVDPAAEEAEAAAAADAAPAAAKQVDTAGGWPSWPFVLVGAPLALLMIAAMRGSARRPRTPLEAANHGRRPTSARQYAERHR